MRDFLKFAYDFFIPRFIEEWVVLEEKEDCLEPVCCLADVREYESFQWMAKSKSLSFFGYSLFARFGKPVPFDRDAKG